jgi:hypothetical protein
VALVLRAKQPKEDGQPDSSAAEAFEVDHEHDHDPAVSPPSALPGPLRLRAVMQVMRAPDLPARAAEQRVVDSQSDRRARLQKPVDEQIEQPQPEIIRAPLRASEEVVRAAVMPLAGKASALQHPGHGAVTDTAREPDEEHAERPKRRLGERWREQGQQPSKRSGNLKHGGDPRDGQAVTTLQRPTADGPCRPPIRGRRPLRLLSTENTRPARPARPAYTAALNRSKPRNSRSTIAPYSPLGDYTCPA